jgi:hypothetical protein
MIPTTQSIEQATGLVELPAHLDTATGLRGLFSNTEDKINHILEGPGSNNYKASLLRVIETTFLNDAKIIINWQLGEFVNLISRLNEDVLSIPEFRFNKILIETGKTEEEENNQAASRCIIVDGITYYPTTPQ